MPADLGAAGHSAAEIQVITDGDWKTIGMVEHYAKAGLRRAGKATAGKAQEALDKLVIPGAEAV
ncbi:hypothetical protein ACFY00_30785 [Kitasatospora sp. NPDC001540]|uniref:hypothetical protein n=1 Tax=Kitasatospora sp. NPDC001540 TaxID=3364014 RepID=UPI00367C885A